ncbi:MAG: hypothetical protein WA985_06425 [Erythrobacter sp.]
MERIIDLNATSVNGPIEIEPFPPLTNLAVIEMLTSFAKETPYAALSHRRRAAVIRRRIGASLLRDLRAISTRTVEPGGAARLHNRIREVNRR